MQYKTIKQYLFYILLPFVFGCTKNNTFSNKYFEISVPSEFKIDSINLGKFSAVKFPGRELIAKDDLESYLYSFYIDDKDFEARKGITISSTVMENNSKKDDKEVILNELTEQQKYFSLNGDKKFEIIVPLKDTIIKNEKYSYYIYSYISSHNKDVITLKRARVFANVGEKIHDIDLAFSNKDKSSIQNQFNELLSVVNTIAFKKYNN